MRFLMLTLLACAPPVKLDVAEPTECEQLCPGADHADTVDEGRACMCYCKPGSFEVSFMLTTAASRSDGASVWMRDCPP